MFPAVSRPIVEFSGVTRAYGARVALDDVSLFLEPGELTFLVGPSGAGKPTFLKLINRDVRPTQRRVWGEGMAAQVFAGPLRGLGAGDGGVTRVNGWASWPLAGRLGGAEGAAVDIFGLGRLSRLRSDNGGSRQLCSMNLSTEA